MNRETKNGKSNTFSTPNSEIGSSHTLCSGPDIAMYSWVAHRLNTSIIPRSWSTSFTQGTRASHVHREQSGLGIGWRFISVSCLPYWMPAWYKWGWHGFYHLQIAVIWGRTFHMCQIHRIVTNHGANWQREIGGCENWVSLFFSLPFRVQRYAAQEVCALRCGSFNGMAVRDVSRAG